MMILCNPHNPGGFVWSRDELARLADLCTEYGVLVASDEIHGDLELFGNRYTPFASVSDAAAQCSVTFGAPSKTFNIAGIVSSWCVVKNPALRRKFFTWLTINEYNVPTFVQTVATEAAYTKAAGWLDERCATSRTTSATRSNFWRSGYRKSAPCARRRRSSYGSTARHWD